jgi:precorrin-6B C5,15-methyltransferase / cobalt-precorrin-6B C5,C15-methyltransferase
MKNPIWVIGVGVEHPPVLSAQAQEIIVSAELLVGGKRILKQYQDHQAEKIPIQGKLEGVLKKLQNRGERMAVVLGSGDPLFHGIGSTLLKKIPGEEIQFIPNLTSLQAAFARVGISWSDACLVSAHSEAVGRIVSAANRSRILGVLTDRTNTPAVIAAKLLESGTGDCRAVVLEHLGSGQERIIDSSLSAVQEQIFNPLNVMIIVQDEDWRGGIIFPNRAETEYNHRRGLITKRDLRALSIARLQIRTADIVWDVGAGSGAVSIEMAALVRNGMVYAVENDQENLGFIRENCERYEAHNIEIISGKAPAALKDLPIPQRVFVGGSGGDLPDILKVINTTAQSGCKVVCNFATLENLTAGHSVMKDFHWSPTYSQISIAQSKRLASYTRLEPLNPVFILEGTVP